MTSSNGYLKKILLSFKLLLAFLLCLSSFFVISSPSFASTITVSNTVIYTLDSEGNLNVEIDYVIANPGPSNEVIKYFTANVPFTDIASYTVLNGDNALESSKHYQNDSTDFVVDFNNLPLKAGQNHSISIRFIVKEYLNKSLSTKQLELPLLIRGTTVNNVLIKIPITLGKLNVDKQSNLNLGKDAFYNTVRVTNPTTESLNLLIGDAISHSFFIKKTLTNNSDSSESYTIALPRSDNTHAVYFRFVTPSPKYAYKDDDNNYFAVYQLASQEELEVQIGGDILFLPFLSNSAMTLEEKLMLTRLNDYWRLDNQNEIKKFTSYIQKSTTLKNFEYEKGIDALTQSERQILYKAVYTYVISELKPLSADAVTANTTPRAGIVKLLENKNSASVEDYADYQIAILRSLGIPSRMVIGYVSNLSDNFEKGFFHTWIEYWNVDRGWISLDPALQDLVNHDLYESELYDHIPLIARGADPTNPKLNLFNESELFFLLNNSYVSKNSKSELTASFSDVYIYSPQTTASISVNNTGNTIIEQINYRIEKQVGTLLDNNHIILPGTNETFRINYPLKINTLLDAADESEMTITAEVKDATDESELFVINDKYELIKYWWWNGFIKLVTLLILILVITIGFNLAKLFVKGFRKWTH